MADLLVKDYNKFDSEWYLKNYCNIEGSFSRAEGFIRRFFCKALSDIFATGKISGDNLLDVGTGPTILSIISATPHVQNIYLSDFNETNRNILKDWADGKRNDGKDICQFILNLEANRETVESRFDEIRRKIRTIIAIDVRVWPMIQEQIPKPDVIIASLVFDAAAQSVEEYNAILKKMNNLLPVGGHLVVTGVLEGHFYKVGDLNFFSLAITESELKAAYQSNGFAIEVWLDGKPENRSEVDWDCADYNKVFALHATKIHELLSNKQK